MVKVCGNFLRKWGANSKKGFGIAEVLISAAVLGILYVALLNLQGSNHEALLRIRGRDGATELAQQILDSLSVVGIVNLADDYLATCGINDESLPVWSRSLCGLGCHALAARKEKGSVGANSPAILSYTRIWKGQPGIIESDMKVKYQAVVFVSPDETFMSRSSSYACEKNPDFCKGATKHVYAKRIDVAVSWKFKDTDHFITVSGVIK